MATTAKGMYHPYAHARGLTVGTFKIAISAGNVPTISDDPGGIVASVSKPAMTTGVYTVVLKRNYSRIHGLAQNSSIGGLFTNVSATVAGGSASNTMTTQTVDHTGNPDNASSTVITVAFFGYDT